MTTTVPSGYVESAASAKWCGKLRVGTRTLNITIAESEPPAKGSATGRIMLSKAKPNREKQCRANVKTDWRARRRWRSCEAITNTRQVKAGGAIGTASDRSDWRNSCIDPHSELQSR